MNQFVDYDLKEFRAFVLNYARHNPKQHHAIQSVLETIIQSELKSSIHGHEPAPDATSSTPQSHTSPQLLNDGEPHCDASPLGTEQNEPTGPRGGTRDKTQNKPTGRRRGTKGKPPPIVVSDPVTKLSSARVRECARRRERSMRAKAGSISPTPPTLSQRTSPTYITDPAPIDDLSAGNVDLPRKRRKRSSGAVAVSNTQPLVETSPASNLIESPTSVQPHTSDEAAVEVPAIPLQVVRKLGLVGGIDILRDLRYTLAHLRSHRSRDLLSSSCVIGTPSISASFDRLLPLRTAQIFSMLRNELDASEIGEQLFGFRKRLAQSRFFEFYKMAQKHPSLFLQANPETTETLSRDMMSKQASRPKSRVFNRIVDLMFPDTAPAGEDVVTAEGSFGQMQRKRQRDQAAKKVHDWRRNGKPWFAMIQRFGEGILLLLPKSLADENIRTVKAAQFEDLLCLMESNLSQSEVLLRSANALSGSLVRYQAPAEILKLETDNTLMDIGVELSRQDLDTLLEPCEVVIPLRESTEYTVQAGEDSNSHALSPPLSSLRLLQVSALRPIHSKDLTSLGTPKAVLPMSHSPVKRGISTIQYNLSPTARLPTPSNFQSTVTSNLTSPTRLLTPTFSLIAEASNLSSPVRHPSQPFSSSTVNSSLSSPARLSTPVGSCGPLGDLRTPGLASFVW